MLTFCMVQLLNGSGSIMEENGQVSLGPACVKDNHRLVLSLQTADNAQ